MYEPTLADIQDTRERIDNYVVETPVWRWRNRELTEAIGAETEVFLKLELLQHTGTFKPRGALRVMLDLDAAALKRGVTAVSAGNHAIAVAYGAQQVGTIAKVVMVSTANPARVAACRAYGGEVVLVDGVHQAFDRVKEIEAEEGRTFVHPYEGPLTALGTATVGLELCRQVPKLDAVIIPVGGGGLCAGIATAVKLLQPACQIFGVEPEGAASMHRSLAVGTPQTLDQIATIADSLSAPRAEPYSFELCRRYMDDLVLIDDDAMRRAMALLFRGVKLAVEPAGAAATAALCGPLRDRLRGKRVGVIVCGSNIDVASFAAQMQKVTG
ncbi:MAG: threonine/serine dehydratase [Anaerolineaceae bacterium]|nr:threonine/serine dehydratase [Anaerolineaceae bacterium]